jgi:FkbM family methyltransferase
MSLIPSQSDLIGKAIRLPLKLIPREAEMPVLMGKLRGKRWIAGSADHSFWLGTYEYRQRRLFERTVAEGSVVFDVGANVGYYTLLASVLAGPAGHVVAFEPVPGNLAYLRRHLSLNAVRNVTVVEAAVADEPGQRTFQTFSSQGGQLREGGDLQVQCVSLDAAVAGGLPKPDVIKMDIEGAEVDGLRGAVEVLRTARPKVFLATHSAELRRQCDEILASVGYTSEVIGTSSHSGQLYVDLLATPKDR